MIIKRSIVFDLENRKYEGKLISDNVPIRIRLTYSGNRIELSTGLRIDRDKWDTKEKKVKKHYYIGVIAGEGGDKNEICLIDLKKI